jgi:hypothetical protein
MFENHESLYQKTKAGAKKSALSSFKSWVDENHDERGFNIHSSVEGATERIFSFLAEDSQACVEWIHLINTNASFAKKNSVHYYRHYQVKHLSFQGVFQHH